MSKDLKYKIGITLPDGKLFTRIIYAPSYDHAVSAADKIAKNMKLETTSILFVNLTD